LQSFKIQDLAKGSRQTLGQPVKGLEAQHVSFFKLEFPLNPAGQRTKLLTRIDDLVKSHEFNDRWLSKKVHIQGGVFFQEQAHTCNMPSV